MADPHLTKFCGRCQRTLPQSSFYPAKFRSGKVGTQSKCRECCAARYQEYRAQKGDELRQKELARYYADKETHKARWERWSRSPEGRARRRQYREEYARVHADKLQASRVRTRASASHKAWRLEYDRMRRREYKHHYDAMLAVYEAIKKGQLVRPPTCQACARPHHRITAHHDDYSKPLDVMWLCPKCHSVADNARRSREAQQ